MSLSINLLQESQKLQARIKRLGVLIQTISFFILIVFSVFVLILISTNLFYNSKYKSTETKIVKTKEEIESLRSVEEKQLLVKQKLRLVSKALEEHITPTELIAEIYEFTISYVVVKDIGAKENLTEINLSGSADDVFSLVSYFNDFTDFSKNKGVEKIVANRITRDDEGQYGFDLTLSKTGIW